MRSKEFLSEPGRGRVEVSRSSEKMKWRWPVAVGVGGLILGGLVATLFVANHKPPPEALVARFAMVLPPTDRLTGTGGRVVAFSPTGTHLIYTHFRDASLSGRAWASSRLVVRSSLLIRHQPLQLLVPIEDDVQLGRRR